MRVLGRGPLGRYKQLLQSCLIKPNQNQLQAVVLLQNLHDALEGYNPRINTTTWEKTSESAIDSPDFAWVDKEKKSTIFRLPARLSRLWSKSWANDTVLGPRGLYIYGGVGTGKSMIMDLFYDSVSVDRKRRVHFHEFMQGIHHRIHHLKQKGMTHDPIPQIAAQLSAQAWLLCFDELQVTNIVDAMLLRRLFGELMNNGVVMVTTSNRHPDGIQPTGLMAELYQNGIQRQSFLPTIALLKERCQVFNLDGGIDYRKQEQEKAPVYYYPLNENSRQTLAKIMTALSEGHPVVSKTLIMWERKMIIPQACGRVAKTTFKQLCGEPRSSAEYLEIARNFEVLIVEGIPRLSLATRNEARRFITLIDALYDRKVKLIASFESNLKELFNGDAVNTTPDRLLMDDLKLTSKDVQSSIFSGDEEVFAFQRAVSRLIEMRGCAWWAEDPRLDLIRNV
ncbi:Lactation elevated protein 1 [Kappamyces sp. JEL0829]|nr:Lactation elevated protein 1 [Kappamyces sp. JEL0829]